jgi:hypothetical protein
MSRHTSFVAVEERETPVEGEVQLRKVPVAISAGWHGMGHGAMRVLGAPTGMSLASSRAPAFDAMPASSAQPRERLMAAKPRSPLLARITQRFRTQEPSSSELLPRLVALQAADGSWDLTDAFAEALGLTRRELERAFASVEENIGQRRRAVDSAVGLAQDALRSLSRLPEAMEGLRRFLLTDLRGLALPAGSTAAEVDAARQAAEDLERRVRTKLEQLLEALERFRSESAERDQLRRAFATAFALRWLQARFADSLSVSSDPVLKAHAWLLTAPLGATFWLEGMDRSQMVP